MDRETDDRWRAALEKKGIDVVRAELDMWPGRPTDLQFGIGNEPPYPTREYCEKWCRGAPAMGFGIAGPTAMVIGMGLLIVVCIIHAVGSLSPNSANWLSPYATASSRQRPSAGTPTTTGTAPTSQLGASSLSAGASTATTGASTSVAGTTDPSQSLVNSSLISTTDTNTFRPSCTSVTKGATTQVVGSLPSCEKLGATASQGNGPHMVFLGPSVPASGVANQASAGASSTLPATDTAGPIGKGSK